MVLSAMAMPAYAYNLTNDCDDNLREGDRAALDTAVEFLDVHRADVFAEIERDSTGSSVLSAPNLYDYTMITPEEYDAWSGEIDDLLYSSSKPFGEVRIACHYSGDNKYCDASTLRGVGQRPIPTTTTLIGCTCAWTTCACEPPVMGRTWRIIL